MYKALIILITFLMDRLSKMYIINLQNTGLEVDIYISPFLNLFLVWNTGIGFGLISLESNIYYHLLTGLILIVNIILIYFLTKTSRLYAFLLALVIGGSLGNLFDRLYYYAVPDFIDFHLGDFHWFIFNIADIFITLGIIGIITIEIFKKEKLTNEK